MYHSTPNMYGTKQMHVARLLIMETGGYQQQYRRSFHSQLDGQMKNEILTQLDGARSITTQKIAQVSGQFFKPQAVPEAAALIHNGWDQGRFRFMLEVQSQDRTGMMNHRQYITGWTDHPGMSHGGALDPEMVFYINHVHTTAERVMPTPVGQMLTSNMIDSAQILGNDIYDPNATGPAQMYTMRPEDIYYEIDAAHLREAVDSGFVADGRNLLLRGTASKSNRMNTVAPVVMSSVLDTYLQTTRAMRDESQSKINEAASDSLASGMFSDDPFMSFVRSANGHSGGKSFRLKDLVALDSTALQRVQMPRVSGDIMATIHNAREGQAWGGSDYTTYSAASLAMAVPSYMSTMGITFMHLVSTNRTLTHQMETTITDVKSPQNRDLSREAEALKFRLHTEIMSTITYGGRYDYQLDMLVDMMGTTVIHLSINDGPLTPYFVPTFCDSLFSPVMTANQQNVRETAADFGRLMTEIIEIDATKHGTTGFGNPADLV